MMTTEKDDRDEWAVEMFKKAHDMEKAGCSWQEILKETGVERLRIAREVEGQILCDVCFERKPGAVGRELRGTDKRKLVCAVCGSPVSLDLYYLGPTQMYRIGSVFYCPECFNSLYCDADEGGFLVEADEEFDVDYPEEYEGRRFFCDVCKREIALTREIEESESGGLS